MLPNTDFEIDYGLLGVLLPVCIYLGKTKAEKLVIMTVMLTLLGYKMGGVQWCGLLVPLCIIFYNGRRGKLKMKYLFYIYYPLHLLGIYLIELAVL